MPSVFVRLPRSRRAAAFGKYCSSSAAAAPEASQTLAMGVMMLGLTGLMLRARKRKAGSFKA